MTNTSSSDRAASNTQFGLRPNLSWAYDVSLQIDDRKVSPLGTSTRNNLRTIRHRNTVHGVRRSRNCLRRPVRPGCAVSQRRRQAGRVGRRLHRHPFAGESDPHRPAIGPHAGIRRCSDHDFRPSADRPTHHGGGSPSGGGSATCSGTGTGTGTCPDSRVTTSGDTPGNHRSPAGQVGHAGHSVDHHAHATGDDRQHLSTTHSPAHH
jgi:hypothetical protein